MTDTVPASPPQQPPNVSGDLYRAVIGPINQAGYLRRFTEFDKRGKTGPTWHWAAFVSALNWLLFRGMWGAALVYAAAMLAVLLGLFGIGRLAWDFSDPTAQILFVGFLGLTSVLAGLYAHAVYYRFCKKKIVQTVGLSTSMQDASQHLRAEASSRKRLYLLAGLNAALLAVLLWGFTVVQNTSPAGRNAAREPASLPVIDQSVSPSAPKAMADRPEAAPTMQSGTYAITASPASSPAAAAAPEVSAATPVASAPAEVASMAKPAASAPSVAKPKSATTTPPAKPASSQADTRYFVQVGVFAVENNALTLQEKLEAAGFRVHTLGMKTPKGVLIQVRVGPFDSKADADASAAELKAMDLPTYIFKLKT